MACILFTSRRTNQQQLWLLIYYLVLGSTILASQSQEETGREHEHGEKHFEFVNVHSSSSSYGEEKVGLFFLLIFPPSTTTITFSLA